MTSDDIRDAIVELQKLAKSAGAKEAPVDPPESNALFPFSVCYLSRASLMLETSGVLRAVETLTLDFHVARRSLPVDVRALLSFYKAFSKALAQNPTLSGKVDTVIMGADHPTSVELVGMEYAGVQTIGLRYEIVVKRRVVL